MELFPKYYGLSQAARERLAVAPRQFDCVVDGVNVTTQNSGEPRGRDETRVVNPDAEPE